MTRILMVASKGGHFQELLQLAPLEEHYQVYYLLEEDGSSKRFALTHRGRVWTLASGGRQAGLAYIPQFLRNTLIQLVCLIRIRPRVIISTGAHTGVVPLLLGRFFHARTVYIESYARVRSLSLSGRILRRRVDLFLCQHQELQRRSSEIRFQGALF